MILKTLVLKVASRCNLNCSYCYMYNLGDKTYLKQPKVMTDRVVDQIMIRVKEYANKKDISKFQFVLHGGEPLLASKDWYTKFVTKANEVLKGIEITYLMQTNGVLYDKEWAEHLDKLNILVGFSWDGPEKYHDKFRVYHNDKGSYSHVVRGMKVHYDKFGNLGALSVLNAEVNPEDYYQNIKDIGITNASILLPILHHSMEDDFKHFQYNPKNITFGKWLVQLFDLWWYDSMQKKPNIRLFVDLIGLILGFPITSEAFGHEENDVVLIETDGGIESSSSLKSIGNGFTKEGQTIFNKSFEEALQSPLIDLFIKSHTNLPEECEVCELKTVCGGGRINQRYSIENGFKNKSLYCQDYKMIISHIQNRLLEGLKEETLEELEIEKINYEEL